MTETVFITGATSGIGETLSIGLSNNYNVIISGRDLKKLESLQKKCSTKNEVYILTLDLASLNGLQRSISVFLDEKNITIDKFVHCAGFMKMVPLKLVSQELIMETFATNIFSANMIIKFLLNRKINNSALNNVVLISSNISDRGAKAMSTYGSSKAALDGMMRSLAVELAPKVRVNSVLPGAVLTEMTKSIFENEEVNARMTAQYPLGIGVPNDIYEAVQFLLSEQSRWITGHQLTVDGGRSINITG